MRKRLASPDENLAFELSRTEAGDVCVTRSAKIAGTGTTSHSVQLPGLSAFDAMHAADPARFDHPQLFIRVRRELERFFDNAAGAASP